MSTQDEMKWERVMKAFSYEPDPSKPKTGPGSRKEGMAFKKLLQEELTSPGVHIETAQGKSSEGKRIDGSAVQLVAYKLLRFARTPRKPACLVALNDAFNMYPSRYLVELKAQATFLENHTGLVIGMLCTKHDYYSYCTEILGWDI